MSIYKIEIGIFSEFPKERLFKVEIIKGKGVGGLGVGLYKL